MAAVNGEAVCQAAREGNIDTVRAYLEAGGDANLSNPGTGRTLLHNACRQGYPEVASLLLSNGANPGAMTLRHLTPLHLACHQGHLKVARLLLEAWAPVDDRDEAATSPLHLAAQKGHIDVVRLLLQCGADKDALDESGWTPVFFASWKGHAAATRMLLQAGANARVTDQRDKITPLHLACSWGQLEVAKVLLEFGADSSAKDCNGAFPDSVIGAGSPDVVDPACARELNEVVVGHRLRIKGASSSLECVVDSLRAKVSELEDQLARAERDRLGVMAYLSDENRTIFPAALKPECPVCQVEVKEAVLDPCRHLAACASCADSLESCSFCACPVRGYQLLESRRVYEHVVALEDEGAGLKAQLKRFNRRVRDLVAANGDLKHSVRRAKAEISVLTAERRGLEERFLLRTPSPSPPPTPPVHDIPTDNGRTSGAVVDAPGLVGSDGERTHGRPSVTRTCASTSVADDGSIHGMDWEQHMGDSKSGGEVVSAGGRSCAGTGLGESKAGVLNHALPNGGADHSGSSNHLIRAAENSQDGGAASSRSQSTGASCNLKQGGVGAMRGDSDEDCSKATGGVASGLELNASEQDGDGGPGCESNSGSERDVDNWAPRDLVVCTRGARSRPSKAANSDDSGSNKCDTTAADVPTISEQGLLYGGPAEPSDGASCGEQISAATSTAQAAGGALDDAPKLNVARPGNEHDFLSRSVPSQHTGARLGSDKILLGSSMGGSGTSAVTSTGLPDPSLAAGDGGHIETQPRRNRTATSIPGSQIVVESHTNPARSGSDDGSGTETSVCEAESGTWPSTSFVVARASAEDISDDENSAKVTREETRSTVRRPRARRRQRENQSHDIINYFLDDSSQSSSSSRSPGG